MCTTIKHDYHSTFTTGRPARGDTAHHVSVFFRAQKLNLSQSHFTVGDQFRTILDQHKTWNHHLCQTQVRTTHVRTMSNVLTKRHTGAYWACLWTKLCARLTKKDAAVWTATSDDTCACPSGDGSWNDACAAWPEAPQAAPCNRSFANTRFWKLLWMTLVANGCRICCGAELNVAALRTTVQRWGTGRYGKQNCTW